jgi:hypothetical protein
MEIVVCVGLGELSNALLQFRGFDAALLSRDVPFHARDRPDGGGNRQGGWVRQRASDTTSGGEERSSSAGMVLMKALLLAAPWRTFRWYFGQRHYSGTYWSSTRTAGIKCSGHGELLCLGGVFVLG